jgi:hypothetical protein
MRRCIVLWGEESDQQLDLDYLLTYCKVLVHHTRKVVEKPRPLTEELPHVSSNNTRPILRSSDDFFFDVLTSSSVSSSPSLPYS